MALSVSAHSYYTPLDYAVFAAFLLGSLLVGVYHAWRAARHAKSATSTKDDFLMGGRKLPIGPVCLSLLTTFISGLTILGAPAEIYRTGCLFFLIYLFGALSFVISGVCFVPIFYKLKPISVYEYFEHRFDSVLLRQLSALLFLFNTLFYMSVVMYAPSVALSGVTGVPMWPFILCVGAASTIYTSIGGLKAVVWTDTLQAGFMYAGIGILIVKGTIEAGGLERIFTIAWDTDRVQQMFRFDPNPAQHNSFWFSSVAAVTWWTTLYGLNQMALQRYCSLPTLRDANKVIAITVPAFLVMGMMACFIGLIMLATFVHDDPIAGGLIETRDQMVVLFATKTLKFLPGLPGLFLACLFSGTLSTISSGMNSMAAVMWEDFLKRTRLGGRLTDRQQTTVNKLLTFTFGCAATALAFLAQHLGGMINAAVSVMGAISGPLIGLFIVGIFFPSASKHGVTLALAVAETLLVWICLGQHLQKPYDDYTLPTNFPPSAQNNYTLAEHANLSAEWAYDPHYGDPDVFYLYKFSSFSYTLIGILMVVLIGVPASRFMPQRTHSLRQMQKQFALTFAGRNEPMTLETEMNLLPISSSNAFKCGEESRFI